MIKLTSKLGRRQLRSQKVVRVAFNSEASLVDGRKDELPGVNVVCSGEGRLLTSTVCAAELLA